MAATIPHVCLTSSGCMPTIPIASLFSWNSLTSSTPSIVWQSESER